jgi:hypothetical protein
MAPPSRMSLHSGLLWLTLNLALIIIITKYFFFQFYMFSRCTVCTRDFLSPPQDVYIYIYNILGFLMCKRLSSIVYPPRDYSLFLVCFYNDALYTNSIVHNR